MSSANRKILVYGGSGALGSVIVDYLKKKNTWVLNVDLSSNEKVNFNVVVNSNDSWINQESYIMREINIALGIEQLDAIFCVAGGWIGGNSANSDFVKNANLMFNQNVLSSIISAKIASNFLKKEGLLQLTGAAVATEGTPSMIGYGLAKAAVHQLVKSLATAGSGFPVDSTVLAIIPITLDTPMNRIWMPEADFSTWTSLNFIAEKLYNWTLQSKNSRPQSGSLLKFVTKNYLTEVLQIN